MQIQILRPSKFLKLCSFCSMSSSFTMFYPVLNPVEWHQKSIQILSKSLVWMVSTKNLWGKIVLRSLWVESCQWRSFLMNFRWFKGPIIFPPHPSESNIKEKFGTSSVFISKKKQKEKCEQSLVLTCWRVNHISQGPPANTKAISSSSHFAETFVELSRVGFSDTQLVVLIQNLGDQFPWNPCDW